MGRTLSRNESRVILDLEWRGQKIVSLAEIRRMVRASQAYARFLAHRLVAKGWLERLRSGIYQLVPAARGRRGIRDSNPYVASALTRSPHFYSFGTACTHHGFTEQVFREIYVVCRERRPRHAVRGRRYVWVYVPESRFFGHEDVKVLGQPICMATRERALLDALDRPAYAGGIGEVSHIVRRAAAKVDWTALLDAVRRWGESAIAQRLGYLLDLHRAKFPVHARRGLTACMRPSNPVYLGPRSRWGSSGPVDPTWNVVQNVPREVLTEESSR